MLQLHRFRRSAAIGAMLAATLWTMQARADPGNPVGFWVTVDDKTGKPAAVVEIAIHGGELTGTVRQIFPQPGQDPEPRCDKCTDARKDQPIKGMQIIWGMKPAGDSYTGGHILDPDEGVTYRCRIRVGADGRTMEVHGYVGIPLLGRSQRWSRQAPPDGAAKTPNSAG